MMDTSDGTTALSVLIPGVAARREWEWEWVRVAVGRSGSAWERVRACCRPEQETDRNQELGLTNVQLGSDIKVRQPVDLWPRGVVSGGDTHLVRLVFAVQSTGDGCVRTRASSECKCSRCSCLFLRCKRK